MALYGTSAAAAAASRSPRDSSKNVSSAITIAPDDDGALDDARQPLLAGPRDKMTLVEVLYAYDLTLAQLTFQKFGRNRAARIAWECLSHSGDGILYVAMALCVVSTGWFSWV
jgi:hypothetical protein